MAKDTPIGTEKILADKPIYSPSSLEAKKSIKWFVDRLQSKVNTNDPANHTLTVGHMYMFRYDAKLKDVLPYWDAAPLVIPISYYKDGFLGMNFHYLPPTFRAALLKMMMKNFGTGNNEKRYMKVTYNALIGLSKLDLFAPTIKRYLYSHMKTQFQRIPPSEWTSAIMLPTARWVGASPKTIYSQSRKKF